MRKGLWLSVLLLMGTTAWAGQIPLPTTLDNLTPAGNYAVVSGLTFADFTYSSSPAGTPPAPHDITVNEFHLASENGITFSGALYAAPGTTVDYTLSYLLTGTKINDAYLAGVFSTFNGTGSVSVGETLLNGVNGSTIGTMEISTSGLTSESLLGIGPYSSILVQKDVIINGGTEGASISVIDQGYSNHEGTIGPPGVPEPAAWVLLSLGVTGVVCVRRWRR